jgi:uncharacterized protein (DUF58 family)
MSDPFETVRSGAAADGARPFDLSAPPPLPPPPPPGGGDGPGARDRVDHWSLVTWRAITPFGRTVAAVGVVSWVLAIVFGWGEFAIIAIASLVAIGVGVVFLFASGADLRVSLHLGARRVEVGEPADTTVQTVNLAPRRMLPTRLEARVGKDTARVQVPGLDRGEAHEKLVVIPTSRRSVVPVGPVRSVQGDPLGLVRREVLWTGTEELIVYPKTTALDPITTGSRRDLEGETTNDRSPSDVAFHTLREYVIGDDLRHIHWMTTARQPNERLMVKEFVDTRRASVGVVLPLRRGDWRTADEFELGVSVAASIGVRAIGDGQDVTCTTGRRTLPTTHDVSFFDSMARVEFGEDDDDAVAVIRRAKSALSRASVVFVIWGSRIDDALARRAVDHIGQGPSVIGLRIDQGAASGRRPGVGIPVLEVGALSDLRWLLGSVR